MALRSLVTFPEVAFEILNPLDVIWIPCELVFAVAIAIWLFAVLLAKSIVTAG